MEWASWPNLIYIRMELLPRHSLAIFGRALHCPAFSYVNMQQSITLPVHNERWRPIQYGAINSWIVLSLSPKAIYSMCRWASVAVLAIWVGSINAMSSPQTHSSHSASVSDLVIILCSPIRRGPWLLYTNTASAVVYFRFILFLPPSKSADEASEKRGIGWGDRSQQRSKYTHIYTANTQHIYMHTICPKTKRRLCSKWKTASYLSLVRSISLPHGKIKSTSA